MLTLKEYDVIREHILNDYRLDANGIHGILHWIRVNKIGLLLAESEGADKKVISLFSLFHDACRHNDGYDPQHGERGAALAKNYFENCLGIISEAQLALLTEACREHSDGKLHHESTIGCCWDADRLDLCRLGFTVQNRFLSTVTAKKTELHEYALALWNADKEQLRRVDSR